MIEISKYQQLLIKGSEGKGAALQRCPTPSESLSLVFTSILVEGRVFFFLVFFEVNAVRMRDSSRLTLQRAYRSPTWCIYPPKEDLGKYNDCTLMTESFA